MNHYRPLLRPAGFATLPRNIKWEYVEAPALDPSIAIRRGLPLSTYRFGVITIDRPLTTEECRQFDLEFVG